MSKSSQGILKNSIAVFIILFIIFKVYFSTVIYVNMTMWYLLWYCNMMWILLAIAMLINSKTLATIALVTATIQTAWYIELVITILGFDLDYHADLLGYLFQYNVNPPMINIANTMDFIIHFFLLPTSFIVVKKMGFDHQSFKPIIIFVVMLLSMSFAASFILPDFHINCIDVAAECGLFEIHNRWLHFLLSIILAIILAYTAFLLLSKLFVKQTL